MGSGPSRLRGRQAVVIWDGMAVPRLGVTPSPVACSDAASRTVGLGTGRPCFPSPTQRRARGHLHRVIHRGSGERRAVPQNRDGVLVENTQGVKDWGTQHQAPGSARRGLL